MVQTKIELSDYEADLIVGALAEKIFKDGIHFKPAERIVRALDRFGEFKFRVNELGINFLKENLELSNQKYSEVLTAGGDHARIYCRAMKRNAYGEAHGAVFCTSTISEVGWQRTAWGKDGKSLSHASLDVPAEYVKGDY